MNTSSDETNPFIRQQANLVFKIATAVGFLLNSIDELDRLTTGRQNLFRAGLKNAARKFQVQLSEAERSITGLDFQNKTDAMEQMHEAYQTLDELLELHLHANFKLTPAEIIRMKQEMMAVATRYGLELER